MSGFGTCLPATASFKMHNGGVDVELSLPYVTASLPGVGGILRAAADDFIVEEVGLYEATGDGQHLYVNLTKSGLTTQDVQIQLAKLFGLEREEVGFAGMKDKYARTTQTFSLNVGQRPAVFAQEACEHIQTMLPVTINWAQFHRNKLRLGHLLGNRFCIRITQLAVPPQQALERAQMACAEIVARGLPNYFGAQRMGNNGVNVRRGLELLTGSERRKIDKWLRRFLISSYQSHLCNRYLARRFERGAFDHLLAGDVAKKYATGGMFDVKDLDAEAARYAAKEISFTAPLFGAKMWMAQAEAGELEASVLAEAPVSIDDFARAHVEGTRRLGRLLVPDLSVTLDGESLVVNFMLTKGAFATIVMRELMKVEDNSLSAVDEDNE